MRIMGKKPSPRDDHALFCIAGPLTGEHDPLLMVVGGFGDGLAGLSDAWLLDVTRGLWKEVHVYTCRLNYRDVDGKVTKCYTL